ncbi:MAG: CPBP family intramembrane metalloprotease [Acholeplasmataceae bacterium]|nr:CPBP family intramembrane metalloprotease [Acholeplasmataceae bacterium]
MNKILAIDQQHVKRLHSYTKKEAASALIVWILWLIILAMMGILYRNNLRYFGDGIYFAFAIALFVYVLLIGRKPGSLGLTFRKLKESCILGAVLALIILIIQIVIGLVEGRGLTKLSTLAYNFFYYFIQIALVEEIIFRGFIQTRLFGFKKNGILTILLGAVLFMSIHLPFQIIYSGVPFFTYLANNYITLLFTMLWHVVFYYLYARFDNLAAPVIFHTFMDWSNYLFR